MFILDNISHAKHLRRFINTLHPSIPSRPVLSPSSSFGQKLKVDQDTLNMVEQASLLRCQNKQDMVRLGDATRLASHLLSVDTSSVEPLVHIHEAKICPLREDVPNIRRDVRGKLLNLASDTWEDYYVVPGK